MAYILEKIGNTYNLPKKYFTCDAKSDLDGISLVDVPIGSEAYCILEEESYILDSNKQWHKKKIGEDLTGQVQADWNQNDETALDYVKNRPFYTSDPVETILVEERVVTFEDNSGIYLGQLDSTFSATIGETYKVSWDGVTYECICADLGGVLVIGNLSIVDEGSDTGEPFLIIVENSSGIQIDTADTAFSHTISISGMALKVVKIDQKYLPTQFKPEGKSYLTFSSPNEFTLALRYGIRGWDGTLEYFASNKTWTTWNSGNVLSAVANGGEYVLYLRGIGNSKIGGKECEWNLDGTDIKCIGNIENLLDYGSVESGTHPIMGDGCYKNMFGDCTALTQAPALPAITLVEHCYSSMFYGCTNLTQAPDLPATTLAPYCYSWMFSSCTALTQAPALPATTLAESCYNYMFNNCTSLTQASALPATILAPSCYATMFYGCTALTQAPALPAITLAERCYSSMFKDCTSLKLSSTKTDKYMQEYRIPSSGNGVTANSALSDMFYNTGGTFTETPEINAIYYLSSDNIVVRETEIATLNGYVNSMIDAAIDKYADTAEYIVSSSTTGSTKKFKITVDDSGTISAVQV